MASFVRRIKLEHDDFPIFIPSKGRPECKTAEILESEGIAFKIIIEPQEIEMYKKWGAKNILILKENNMGIAYTRNFVMEYTKIRSISWCWIFDDDLASFWKTISGKNVKCKAREAISYAESKLKKSKKIAQASFEYQQYAWSMDGKPRVNSYNDCFVAFDTAKMREKGIKWDESFKLKSDRDVSIQILKNGYNNVRFTNYSFSCPENGSNEGGLHFEYQKKSVERLSCFDLERKWGSDIVEVKIKPSGRVDAKIKWNKIK